ncbi:MAG: diguanylate cyclase (GGDEF)-like protein/PAS domain S-box-containing protein [Ilumatobacter sp.]|jgi:diguanylate cyclase (GGDEF)-like protein/PAS domain S-box-containing protein
MTSDLTKESAQRPAPVRQSKHLATTDVAPSSPSIDRLADPVLAIDTSGVLRYANARAAAVLGWDPIALIGESILPLVHPDDVNLVAASMATVTGKDYGQLLQIRALHGRGTWVHLELRGAMQQSDDGDDLVVIVARHTTDRYQLDFDQGDVEMLRSVMNTMQGMITLLSKDGNIRSINGAVTRLLGHDPELVRNQSFSSYLHPDDRQRVLERVKAIPTNASDDFDARLRSSDGVHHVCEFTVSSHLEDPVVNGYIVSGRIASALVDARERVDFLAVHDNHTGLLNRDGFMKAAQAMTADGGGLGILVIDIVNFRGINELYGEPVGDAVLSAVAGRLDRIRQPDLITARLGGDEFVMAVRSSNDAAIEMLRERVCRDVGLSITLDNQEVNFAILTATAFEPTPRALESLLVSASKEMMSIKRRVDPGSGGISFEAINERRAQLEQLRSALDNGEILPFFQPIVDVRGTVTAVEALVRWVHPIRGVLGVGEILPLAQMAGLAEAVDDHVLEMALQFARRLDQAGHGSIEVHVNVDPKVIASPSFGHSFLNRCARLKTRPDQVVVEITETDLLDPGAISLSNMNKLRRAGTHVAIDDFGTGYSSLAHLLELPVDGLKIDRRFVAGIDLDPAATNLTTAILSLSKSLRIACVAEGVEQPYQRDRLFELGCTAFQGWLFSPAVPPEELLMMLPIIAPAIADDTPRPAPLR